MKKQHKIFGEKLVTCKFHPVRYWFAWLLAIIFFIGFVTYLFQGKSQDAFILLIPVVLFAGLPLLRIASNKIVLTDKAIYGKSGLVRTKELSSPIDKIQNLREESGLLGKAFGYSTLYVDTISESYIMKGVKHANELIGAYYNIKK